MDKTVIPLCQSTELSPVDLTEKIMKKYFVFCLAILWNQILGANEAKDPYTWDIRERDIRIEMRYPNNKLKAIVLSYDDGFSEDLRLVQLLNKYGLRGTFHINSARLSTPNYMKKKDIKEHFGKHEISAHGANHQGLLGLTPADRIYEFIEDRRALEALSGKLVRGMAYPFGSYDPDGLELLESMGFEYARTVEATHDFRIPANFLLWHPSAHKFGVEDDPARDGATFQLVEDFLSRKHQALLYLWGHSWEYQKKWAMVEELFSLLSGQPDVVSLTHIDLVAYLKAFRQLRISADKTIIHNPSATKLFLRVYDGRLTSEKASYTIELEPAATLRLEN